MMNCILVDDEHLALDRLSRLLEGIPTLKVQDTFLDPEEALSYLKKTSIDVVFLDISLPGFNGLELADQLLTQNPETEVVFVTGYDEYAVKAFELNAIDYLLKPVAVDRLLKTVEKLNNRKNAIQKKTCPYAMTLGGFSLIVDGEPLVIKWRTNKTEELFALLIHHLGKKLSRDYVLDALWRDTDVVKATDYLNVATYNLRKVLRDAGISDFIQTSKTEIWIRDSAIQSDALIIEEGVKRILPLRDTTVSEAEKISNLYKGDYFDGKDYLWAEERRYYVRAENVKILLGLIDYYESANMKTSLSETFKRLLALEPDFEEVHERLIKFYLSNGQLIEAQKHYRAYKKMLEREYRMEPTEEMRQLMNEV